MASQMSFGKIAVVALITIAVSIAAATLLSLFFPQSGPGPAVVAAGFCIVVIVPMLVDHTSRHPDG